MLGTFWVHLHDGERTGATADQFHQHRVHLLGKHREGLDTLPQFGIGHLVEVGHSSGLLHPGDA